MSTSRILIYVVLLSAFFLKLNFGFTQVKTIKGIVIDKQSAEPISYVSVYLAKGNKGILTDTVGKFAINIAANSNNDTLKISGIGYKTVSIPINLYKNDTANLIIKLEVTPPQNEVAVKSKYNRAVWFWKKIMKNKPKHQKSQYANYSYEIYNKLELDIINLNREKFKKNGLLKPLNFVLDYIDTITEDKPYLPVYLTETLSDFYYQKDPKKTREIIKASKTNGIENESIIKQLGGTYQNVDIYSNYITIFTKQFVSPFNDNATSYYNFKLLDTQYLNKKRLIHLRFTPKQKGDDVFVGDCYVNDTSFAVQKITLKPSVDANINFIGGLSIIQEFALVNDTTWFLYKDKFIADITPIGEKNLAFKGRKTATYQQVKLNANFIYDTLNKNERNEQIDLVIDGKNLADSFWDVNRHEPLNNNEKSIYQLIDTLKKNPTYQLYKNTVKAITTGYVDKSKVRFGPWYYWCSMNPYEGFRNRFDISTNNAFSKKWYLSAYLAYGHRDGRFKGRVYAKYFFNKPLWTYVQASYRDDIDNGQVHFSQLGNDNIFATIFRRTEIPFKLQRSAESRLEFYKETHSGFHFGANASYKKFQSLTNLPTEKWYPATTSGSSFQTFEVGAKLKFAYLERVLEDNDKRFSLGSDLPIVELNVTKGLQGVGQSSYNYEKYELSLIDVLKIPPMGKLNYTIIAGKINGKVPFQLLEILPGNEFYYYVKHAYSLMNRFEYFADEYVGLNVEHSLGSGLFKYIPFTRKLKLRQFWNAKSIIGNLSKENRDYNFVGNYPFKSLDGNVYVEVGTGIENIFKLFRIDFVWRLTPTSLKSPDNRNFGVFGSYKLNF